MLFGGYAGRCSFPRSPCRCFFGYYADRFPRPRIPCTLSCGGGCVSRCSCPRSLAGAPVCRGFLLHSGGYAGRCPRGRAPAVLALAPLAVILAYARTPAVLALAPLAVMLAYARAPAVLAFAPLAVMLADASAPAVLAVAPLAVTYLYMSSHWLPAHLKAAKLVRVALRARRATTRSSPP